MKRATLIIIPEYENVLMGEKKTGEIGQNLINAPGGKIEPGETPLACALRETWEELGIKLLPQLMEEIAVITFYTADVPDFEVYVYRAGGFVGKPRETESMIPRRFRWNRLPFDRMHDGDAHWFTKALHGHHFNANVYYRERAQGFERIVFFPFTPFPS